MVCNKLNLLIAGDGLPVQQTMIAAKSTPAHNLLIFKQGVLYSLCKDWTWGMVHPNILIIILQYIGQHEPCSKYQYKVFKSLNCTTY
jgi:hypothetical protein